MTSALDENQLKYLETIDENALITIKDFDPRAYQIGIDWEIKLAKIPKIISSQLIGSLVAKIGGQNDIDILLFTKKVDMDIAYEYLNNIIVKSKFEKNLRFSSWQLYQEGYEINIYLNDENDSIARRHLVFSQAISNNSDLAKEYEKYKNQNKTGVVNYKSYLKRKYEFINTFESHLI